MSGLTRDGDARTCPDRSDSHRRERGQEEKKTFFSVQLTTSRIGNHTRLMMHQSARRDERLSRNRAKGRYISKRNNGIFPLIYKKKKVVVVVVVVGVVLPSTVMEYQLYC